MTPFALTASAASGVISKIGSIENLHLLDALHDVFVPSSSSQDLILHAWWKSSHRWLRRLADNWSSPWMSSTTWCCIYVCIHRKSHKYDWSKRIRDFLEGWKSSLGTWSCMPKVGKWFQEIVYLYQRSHQETGSWLLGGNRRTRTIGGDRNIDREYHHKSVGNQWKFLYSGTRSIHTLIGASNSNNIGWEMKISRALVHRYLISASNNWTCFPGLLPRTSNRRSMTESRSTSFWSAIML